MAKQPLINRCITSIAYTIDGLIEYIGLAVTGSKGTDPNWQIRKVTYVGKKHVAVQFADGDTKFDNIWDNRAALPYS